jgi:hypothetical protein
VLPLAALLALLFGAALYFALRGDSKHGIPVPEASHGTSSPSTSPAPAPTQAERIAQPAPSSAPVHGRVVDDTFGTPLLALVEPDKGPSLLTDPSTGTFELGSAHAGCTQISVSAPNFEPARAHAEAELEIRLRAKHPATLVVSFADGSPAADARVEWRAASGRLESDDTYGWFDTAKLARGTPVATKTDANGVARIDAGHPVIGVVHDPRRNAARTVRVLPGEERRITLSNAAVELHVVDFDTREPLAGVELESWLAREPEALSEPLVTDANGDVAIETPSFPLSIRRRGAAAFQYALIALSPGAAQCGLGGDRTTMLRIDAPPPPGALLVGMRACGGRVKLVDALTRKPLEVEVHVGPWYGSEASVDVQSIDSNTKRSPRLSFGARGAILLRSSGGIIELPDTVYAADGSDDGKLVGRELLFLIPGYHPVHASITTERGAPDAALPVVEFQPAPQRTLRVVHRDGSPFVRPIEVFSPHENTLLWLSSGAPDGVHGPIDWLGGDWIVNRESRVPASELEAAEGVTLTLPDETGVIVLEGIPAGFDRADLLALGGRAEEKTEYRPTRIEANSCRFEGLPAGTFVVGPAAWVRVADWQSFRREILGQDGQPLPMRTKLADGESVTLRWQSSWSAERAIEGQVRVLGPGHIEPLLFPYYVPVGSAAKEDPALVPHMIFSRKSPRIPLDRDGRYRIEPGEPVPWMIAVCLAEPQYGSIPDINALRVLDTILPGESADIATGAVELVAKGNPRTDALWVTYELPPAAMRHPLSTAFQTARARWVSTGPLRLEGIPLSTSELRVEGKAVPLRLEPAGTTRVEVELGPARR